MDESILVYTQFYTTHFTSVLILTWNLELSLGHRTGNALKCPRFNAKFQYSGFLPTKMILGTYCPSGERCLSVVSYCQWRKRSLVWRSNEMFVPSFHASHGFKWNWLWGFPVLTNEPNRARIHLMVPELDKLTTRFRTINSSSIDLWSSTSSAKAFFRAAREGKEGTQRRGPWFVVCVCGAGLTLAVWTILQVEDDHQRLVAETQAPFC